MKVKEVAKAQEERLRAGRMMPLPNSHKHRDTQVPRPLKITAAVVLAAALSLDPLASGAELTPATEHSFNHYIERTEGRMQQDFRPEKFLSLDAYPDQKAKVRNGEKLIDSRKTLDRGKEISVPGGLIQDWSGAMFIPNTTIAQVRSVMQAYPEYKVLFAPEITESKVLSHQGDRYGVFLRLYKKQILTVVLNATYDIEYRALDARHLAVDSRSTRIAEVKDGGRSNAEEPVGHDSGFLWRLNSYWRFEEADGGVYAELEAISLSRDVPFGLLMIRKFVERFPKESMEHTLDGVRRAVAERSTAAR